MDERRMRPAVCSGPSRSRFAGRGDGAAFRSALSERPAPPPAEASPMPDAHPSMTPSRPEAAEAAAPPVRGVHAPGGASAERNAPATQPHAMRSAPASVSPPSAATEAAGTTARGPTAR